MARQCLYCAKELPKNSTSNFCSKECWTEYKKLKSMNVGADKQATVLLRRPDVPSPPEPQQPPSTPPSDIPQPEHDTLNKNLEHQFTILEKSLQQEIAILKEKIETLRQSHSVKKDVSDFSDFEKRLHKLETAFERIEPMVRIVDKLEERIVSVEKKIRNLSPGTQEPKKGFWTKLFG